MSDTAILSAAADLAGRKRENPAQQSPAIFKKFMEFSEAIKTSSVDQTIRHLVEIRASQINGCAFCLDMHIKQAKIRGERDLRIHHIAVWHESPLFTPREKAALLWTETLTHIPHVGVGDEIYNQVRAHFSEREISDLTFVAALINTWNRMNIAFKTEPGIFGKMFGLDRAGLA